MKSKKILMFLLVLVLTITCMPLTAMASESHVQEIDILSGGFYITDPDGNIVLTPKYIIDEDVSLAPGYSLVASNNVYYNGGVIVFSASVSGASVTNLKLSAQRTNPSTSYKSLGYFTRESGDWYGTITKSSMPDGYGCYYRLKFTNNNTATLTIDSITGYEEF